MPARPFPRLTLKPLLGAMLLALAPTVSAYDLHDAYVDALGNDAQLSSARALLEVNRERVPQAQSLLRPSLRAGAAVNQNWVDTNLGPSTDYTSQTYSLSGSYPLLSLANVQVVEQSKLQFSIAEAQFLNAQQDLILRVSDAYFDVLASANSLRTIQSEKRAISEQLAAAKRNFEVGTATITDQQEAQARFDLTVARELAALNDLDIKRSALSLLTGKAVSEVSDLQSGLTLTQPEPADERNWTSRARDQNLGVQQAILGTEVARREIARQRYAGYPTINVVGQLAHARNATATLQGVNSNSAAIGLQLGIPLYTGGAIDARVREASANLDKTSADVEVAKRQAEQAARQFYLGLVNGLGQVRALEAAEKSSKLALDSNQLGYQVGVRINIDVLNAQQQLFSTQRDLARARYDVLINGLRLKSVTGGLSEPDLRGVSALLTEPRTAKPELLKIEPAAKPAAPAAAKRPARATKPVAPGGRPTRR